ncbi:MAG: M23 family peptidase, partial [Microcystaceae cyanobacterium]
FGRGHSIHVPTGLIRAGFAPQPPEQQQLWQEQFGDAQLAQNIPALVFWVHAFGVLQGDVEHFRLSAPDGQAAIDQENPLKDSSRSWVSYVGKRNNAQTPISSGVWRGQYQLRRGNHLIVEVEREVVIK